MGVARCFLAAVPPRPRARPSSSGSAQEIFGRRVRAMREARGWTQAELAEFAGLDVSYVSQVERGLRDPSLSSITALAKGLGVGLGELVGHEAATTPGTILLTRLAGELGTPTPEQATLWIRLIRTLRETAEGLVTPSPTGGSKARSSPAKKPIRREPRRA